MHFVYVHARECVSIEKSMKFNLFVERRSDEYIAALIADAFVAWHGIASAELTIRFSSLIPTPNTNFNRLWHPLVTKNRFNFPSVYISNRLPFRFDFVSSFHLHAVCVFLLYLCASSFDLLICWFRPFLLASNGIKCTTHGPRMRVCSDRFYPIWIYFLIVSLCALIRIKDV